MEHKLEAADLAALEAIAPGRVFTGGQISEDYGHDELGDVAHMPEALVKVRSTEEVARILEYADRRLIPVVVRGSGTGLVGASVAVRGGIMLETTGMNRILELDEENLTVTVQPGVLLMDLAEFVESRGFFYPPDPGEKSATIGGNISTNAGGMRAVKYGVTRDYVRGLTVVLPGGRVMELGGKVVKNSSGYSLKDLIVGSEGTLGVVTEAVLRLLPLPQRSVSLLVPFESMEKALEVVPRIIRAKAIPTAIEYMARETILLAESYLGKQFPDKASAAYILFTFDGSTAAQVEAELDMVAEQCLQEGAQDAFIVDTDERKKSVWDARGAFLEAIKASTTQMDECDVVVPRSCVARFIRYTYEVARQVGLRIPSFGHAGDGNLHVYLCRDELDKAEFDRRLARAFELMYAEAARLGGLVSGEHGIGWAKKEYLARQYGPVQMELMRGIKRAFDPNGILNPDKHC